MSVETDNGLVPGDVSRGIVNSLMQCTWHVKLKIVAPVRGVCGDWHPTLTLIASLPNRKSPGLKGLATVRSPSRSPPKVGLEVSTAWRLLASRCADIPCRVAHVLKRLLRHSCA